MVLMSSGNRIHNFSYNETTDNVLQRLKLDDSVALKKSRKQASNCLSKEKSNTPYVMHMFLTFIFKKKSWDRNRTSNIDDDDDDDNDDVHTKHD